MTADQATLDFIRDNNPIFCLFEGVCPECGEEVKMTSAGGTLDFLQEWDWDETVDPVIWDDNLVDYKVGGIGFTCSNGHKHYVEKNIHGDWS